MMTRDDLKSALRRDEGTGPVKDGRFFPYWDCCARGLRASCSKGPTHQGRLTVGYGHNIESNGLSVTEVDFILDRDINDAVKLVMARFPWAADLDPVRQAVLVEMAFNMGIDSLSGFTSTLGLVKSGTYDVAAVHLLQSKYARDVGDRALRLAQSLSSGVWV